MLWHIYNNFISIDAGFIFHTSFIKKVPQGDVWKIVLPQPFHCNKVINIVLHIIDLFVATISFWHRCCGSYYSWKRARRIIYRKCKKKFNCLSPKKGDNSIVGLIFFFFSSLIFILYKWITNGYFIFIYYWFNLLISFFWSRILLEIWPLHNILLTQIKYMSPYGLPTWPKLKILTNK